MFQPTTSPGHHAFSTVSKQPRGATNVCFAPGERQRGVAARETRRGIPRCLGGGWTRLGVTMGPAGPAGPCGEGGAFAFCSQEPFEAFAQERSGKSPGNGAVLFFGSFAKGGTAKKGSGLDPFVEGVVSCFFLFFLVGGRPSCFGLCLETLEIVCPFGSSWGPFWMLESLHLVGPL